jgi:hypothetical protein
MGRAEQPYVRFCDHHLPPSLAETTLVVLFVLLYSTLCRPGLYTDNVNMSRGVAEFQDRTYAKRQKV